MSFSVVQRVSLALLTASVGVAVALDWIGIPAAVAAFALGAAAIVTLRPILRGLPAPLPKGVAVYEVTEPFLVGLLPRTVSALCREGTRAIVLKMDAISVITESDAASLESALAIANGTGCLLLLASLQPQPYASLTERAARIRTFSHFDDALDVARLAVAMPIPAGAPT